MSERSQRGEAANSTRHRLFAEHRFVFANIFPVVANPLVRRVQPEGFGVVGDRLVVLPLVAPDVAPVVVRHGVFRVEADRLFEVGNRPVQLLLVAQARPRLLYARAFLGSSRMASLQSMIDLS